MFDHASMVEKISPYVRACPGPPVAAHGLVLAAYQEIPEIGAYADVELALIVGRAPYLRSVNDVAASLRCRADYLSRAALRRGYSYSKALRWITLLHGLALHEGDVSWERVAWRLRFNDAAGWSRFTRRLIGKTPKELPRAPLTFWAWEAIRDVFLGASSDRGSSFSERMA